MEYQILEKTGTLCLYQTFMKAFSDYQVIVDMPYEVFETKRDTGERLPAS